MIPSEVILQKEKSAELMKSYDEMSKLEFLGVSIEEQKKEWKMKKQRMVLKAQMKAGQHAALKQHFQKFYYDYYLNNMDLLEEVIPANHKKYFGEWRVEKNSKERYKYLLITVNPYSNCPFALFHKKIIKSLKKKYIVSSQSCVEWIKLPTLKDNGGMHFHTRIEINNKDPYSIKREFYNTFKEVAEPQCVSVRYSNTKDSFCKYVSGLEKDKTTGLYRNKDCKSISQIVRKQYDLPDNF